MTRAIDQKPSAPHPMPYCALPPNRHESVGWRLAVLALALFVVLFSAPGHAQKQVELIATAVLAPAAAKTPPAPVPVNDSAQLQREIDELRDLIAGKLPLNMSLPALFEIDLSDDAAVQQRVQVLRERLSELRSQPAPAVKNDIETLRIERDTLRLAFLSLPVQQRIALSEQDRLRRKGQALATEQQTSAAVLASTEQARDSALSAAGKATDDVARVLATEEARLLAHLSELAALRQSWAARNQVALAEHTELIARYAAVDLRKGLDPAHADALYKGIRADLSRARDEADAALSALTARSLVVPLDGELVLTSPAYAGSGEQLARIRQLRGQIALEQAEMRVRETAERYSNADEIMRTLRTLQARRVALLPMLSTDLRDEVTGFSSAGFDRIVSEVSHVRLMLRWYPVQRLHEAKSFASLLKNVFEAGRFGAELLGLLLVLGGIFVVLRRGRDWLGRLRAWLYVRVQPRTLMLRVDGTMKMLMRVINELLLLLTVYVIFDQFFDVSHGIPEMVTLRKLAYAYAYYALALAFIHRVMLVAVSRYREVEPSLNEKILQSLRLVARVVLFFAVFLILAQAMLGRGALYGIAQNVAVVGGLLVAWLLIRAWRTEVSQSYLNFSPVGRLADLVRASQGHSHSLLIVAMAFVYVAARGLWIWMRDSALGFEQTRKALAYLFRRQLERQSKSQPLPSDPSLLPVVLQQALTEEAAFDDLCIDHYPHLDKVFGTAEAMRAGQPGALVAVTGYRGAGKTTWLLALQRRIDKAMPCTLYTFDQRTPSPDDVCRILCEILELEPTTDPALLIAQASQLPPRVVLLDLCQNLMLRAVGGLAGYELFIKVAQATVGNILWVATYARWPFEYLQRTHPGRDVYHHVIKLKAWSEQQIGALIDARMEVAGFTADYDQLLLNAPTLNAPMVSASAAAEAVERTADRYNRLIWDYADGNPRVALHFFRLSLDWTEGTTVSVRLFPMPLPSELEEYEVRTQFILACLVQHENLNAIEAAASLRFPLAECEHALLLLHNQGYLICNEGGRYRIACHWSRAVMRFLQRKKLLVV